MNKKGFSIAEAMITLLIISVALAAMAPMMTKKVKPVTGTEKWVDALTVGNITRPTGLVGIGVDDTANPEAKLHIKTSGTNSALKIDSNNNSLTVNKDGKMFTTSTIAIAKTDENEERIILGSNGVIKTRPKYDEDNTALLVKNNSPNIPDGEYVEYSDSNLYTKNAIKLLSNGGIRLNYIESEKNKSWDGPLGIYVDSGNRFWIYENGRTDIYYTSKDARVAGNTVFTIRRCGTFCGPDDMDEGSKTLSDINAGLNGYAELFNINSKGTTKIAGDVVFGPGETSLSGTVTAVNEELKSTREMIAMLKEQNDILKAQNEALSQRVAILESDRKNPVNDFNRIVENNINNFLAISKNLK